MSISNESEATRLELLRMAVQLVTNEYIDKRAQDHNAWVAKSDLAWKARREKVPYPPFPPYPNEADIVARANILCDFLHREPPDPAKPSAPTQLQEDEPTIENYPEATVVKIDPVPVVEETVLEEPVIPAPEPVPEPVAEPEPVLQEVAQPAPVPVPEPVAEPEPLIDPVLPQAPVVDVSVSRKEIEAIFSAPSAIPAPDSEGKVNFPEIIYPAVSERSQDTKSIIDDINSMSKSSESSLPLFANWRAAWRKPLSQ